ncbi:Clr5 domain-containing protein [Xylariomycetidae sp. FL0641]|nr:Clr5 domain-containing protein [Xylariomycetidae sp. FL0641]
MVDLATLPSEASEESQHNPMMYAKPFEWPRYKEVIKQLYVDEGNTLDRVKQIMLDEHQFNATTSMYKKRIREWGFGKKLKESEVLVVLRDRIEKSAAGKPPGPMTVRGQVVDAERIRRYLERKPTVLFQLPCFDKKNPKRLALASHPNPLPALRSPPALRKMEKTLTALRDYIQECAAGPEPAWRWTFEGYSARNQGVTNLLAARMRTQRAIDEFYDLQKAIDDSRPNSVIFPLVNSTLNRFSEAITYELPDLFFPMIEILRQDWPTHPQLLKVFHRHLQELVAVRLGCNHPLAVLWGHVLRENVEETPTLSLQVLEMLLGELTAHRVPRDGLSGIAFCYLLRGDVAKGGTAKAAVRYKEWVTLHPWWEPQRELWDTIGKRLADYPCNLDLSGQCWRTTSSPSRTGDRDRASHGNAPATRDGNFVLVYLQGRIFARLGDSARAEAAFLEAKQAAWNCRGELDYRRKVLENLQLIYEATSRRTELSKVTEELESLTVGRGILGLVPILLKSLPARRLS